MAQEIEIEYKILLSEKKFNDILNSLEFPKEPFVQTNYYFETPDFKLKSISSALRIRKKNADFIVTLKEPHPKGILETHDRISEKDFQKAIDENELSAPNCRKQLQNKGIPLEKVEYVGSLTTERYEFKKNELIYVLDKSFYNGQTDYELEIEAPSQAIGKQIFNQLLKQFQIKRSPSITKIERFFNTIWNTFFARLWNTW